MSKCLTLVALLLRVFGNKNGYHIVFLRHHSNEDDKDEIEDITFGQLNLPFRTRIYI